MNEILEQIVAAVSQYAPRVLAALAVLVVGWLIALAISAGVRSVLRRTGLNDRLPRWLASSDTNDAAAGLAKFTFYILMLFVLVATFQVLGLTMVTEPLNSLLNQLFAYAPQILGGAALLIVALLLATGVRSLLSRVLVGADVDGRLGRGAGTALKDGHPIARSLAETAYWLILLLFLPAILGALGMRGLLAPVEGMIASLVGFLPNLLAATVIFAVGWFVARIVQRVVSGLLAAAGTDGLATKTGLDESVRISHLMGGVVYALILIPVAVAALNALQLDAVTAPASRMLEMILGALPQIFAAALILGLSHVVGKLVAGLVTNVLSGIGFDRLPAAMGIVPAAKVSSGPSRWLGAAVHVAIMLFAVAEAAGQLNFTAVSDLSARFLVFVGQIGMGLIILVGGMLLANVAAGAVRGTGRPQSATLATVARIAVLVLTGAMALREMGFAEDIVNLTFGLLLGAVAVAAALAFGIGGRDTAAQQLSHWRKGWSDQNEQSR
jgi:hypothetical protein